MKMKRIKNDSYLKCMATLMGIIVMVNILLSGLKGICFVTEDSRLFITGQRVLPAEASGQREIDYDVLEKKWVIDATQEDYETLLRIVEAEAGCEDEEGKILVANVIINRVKSARFPNSISKVVFQKEQGVHQFSPIGDGRFYSVFVSEETKECVERALSGEDYAKGALFFAARKAANPERMRWFDNHLTFVFSHGGHEFFR